MKELSIEQKAKSYDEAYKKVAVRFGSNVADEIFLKDSEDERIRKDITAFFKNFAEHGTWKAIPDVTKWIAWFEKHGEKEHVIAPKFNIGDTIRDKITNEVFTITDRCISLEYYHDVNHLHEVKFSEQDNWELVGECKGSCAIKRSEQKPVNKIEPKFHEGDWCIDNEDGTIFQIVKVLDNTYTYKTNEGKEYSCTHYSLENDAKLWTIEDAKDGDVLVDVGNNIGIYKKIEGICWHSYIYLGCDNRLYGFNIGGSHVQNNTKPATKEQRDLLFQKMREAGYEWDADKKELKKIEQYTADKVKPFDKFEGLTDFERTLADICIGWIGEELGWKQYIKDNADVLLKIAVKKFNSVQDAPFEQKSAWSEDDEKILKEIITDVRFEGYNNDLQANSYRKIRWLKSLKDRYTWKPSEGQLECLGYAIEKAEKDYSPLTNNRVYLTLKGLLEHLKAL